MIVQAGGWGPDRDLLPCLLCWSVPPQTPLNVRVPQYPQRTEAHIQRLTWHITEKSWNICDLTTIPLLLPGFTNSVKSTISVYLSSENLGFMPNSPIPITEPQTILYRIKKNDFLKCKQDRLIALLLSCSDSPLYLKCSSDSLPQPTKPAWSGLENSRALLTPGFLSHSVCMCVCVFTFPIL